MKQHLELGIIVAMSAMMVFAMTAYMTPSANAAVSGGSEQDQWLQRSTALMAHLVGERQGAVLVEEEMPDV